MPLVFVALFPAFGLILSTAVEQRRVAAVDARNEAVRFARLGAPEESRVFESARQLLATLAQVPAVRSRTPASAARSLPTH